ncbi:MAG: arsenic resistance protein [Gammaproteobacteria bacterium]|nr:arsenic resistance protein [Gammaproteobacteria bacterium]
MQSIKTLHDFLQKYLILIVLVIAVGASAWGIGSPEVFKPLKGSLPYALFAMLYPMMIGINLRSMVLHTSPQKTRYLIILTVAYVLVFPALAWVTMKFLGWVMPSIDPAFIAGIVLISLAPIPSSAPAFTGMAGGKTQLVVIGVAWTFVLSLFVMPFYSHLLLNAVISVPVWTMVKSLLIYIIVPLAAGQLTKYALLHYRGEDSVKQLKPAFSTLAVFGTLWMVFVVFGLNGRLLSQNVGLIIVTALVMNVVFLLRMGGNYFAGRFVGLGREYDATLFYSAGSNMTIATAIAIATWGPLAAVGVAMGGPFSDMLIMVLFIGVFARMFQRRAAAESDAVASEQVASLQAADPEQDRTDA